MWRALVRCWGYSKEHKELTPLLKAQTAWWPAEKDADKSVWWQAQRQVHPFTCFSFTLSSHLHFTSHNCKFLWMRHGNHDDGSRAGKECIHLILEIKEKE